MAAEATWLRPAPGSDHGSDRGSLVMAILLTVVATMAAGLLVPVVVAQSAAARYDGRRDRGVDVARAGLQVTIGKIRDARNSVTGAGQTSSLPCSATGSITGANQHYRTTVYYFAADPRGHDDWLSQPSTQIACTPGSGTGTKIPAFAGVVADGSDDIDGGFTNHRTLEATYRLSISNAHIPGGLIGSPFADICMDAGSATPSSGTQVTMQTCASGAADQTWVYNSNFTISLRATADPSTNALGMCLDAPYPHTLGEALTVMPCSNNTTPEQQWSFQGLEQWASFDQTTTSEPFCWNFTSPKTVGSLVVLGNCVTATPGVQPDATHAFYVESTVGTGGADAAHKFLVNYAQFGRCLTIPNAVSKPGDPFYEPFLLNYTCSSSPDPNDQPINIQFNFPQAPTTINPAGASGNIISLEDNSRAFTSSGGTVYCLWSPLIDGGKPYISECANATTAADKSKIKWTVYGDTGNYSTSYRITDNAGLCLQPADSGPADPSHQTEQPYSQVIVTACDDDLLQKWNAPAGAFDAVVTDLHEK